MLRVFKKIRFSWSLTVLGVFYLYLGFHAFSGDQGILSWADYADRIDDLESEIKVLETSQIALQSHVNQLRSEHLDLDRLDEEARKTLNISRPNEIVIWLDEDP
ncbi:MAG: septum formation initiator family protein [Robiginitomaculum sp.]